MMERRAEAQSRADDVRRADVLEKPVDAAHDGRVIRGSGLERIDAHGLQRALVLDDVLEDLSGSDRVRGEEADLDLRIVEKLVTESAMIEVQLDEKLEAR